MSLKIQIRRWLLIVSLSASIILCLYLFRKDVALPTGDLASPSQEIRDRAAIILRAKSKPTRKYKWFFLTLRLKEGETEEQVLALARAYNPDAQPEAYGFGGLVDPVAYRLDDCWLLAGEFNNNDVHRKTLERWKLVPIWRVFAVWPATNFTGHWINYFANGQKFTEGDYRSGQRNGEYVTYDQQGLKRFASHYEDGKANGSCFEWFPSGKLRMQCQYSNNVKIGIEVRYNEDGTTNMIEDYSKH